MRRAVRAYLDLEKGRATGVLDDYFGFLKGEPAAFDGMDALDYQQDVRGDWDDRDALYGRWGFQDADRAPYKHRKNEDGAT